MCFVLLPSCVLWVCITILYLFNWVGEGKVRHTSRVFCSTSTTVGVISHGIIPALPISRILPCAWIFDNKMLLRRIQGSFLPLPKWWSEGSATWVYIYQRLNTPPFMEYVFIASSLFLWCFSQHLWVYVRCMCKCLKVFALLISA